MLSTIGGATAQQHSKSEHQVAGHDVGDVAVCWEVMGGWVGGWVAEGEL